MDVLTTSAGCVSRDARIPDTKPHIETTGQLSSSLPRPRQKQENISMQPDQT